MALGCGRAGAGQGARGLWQSRTQHSALMRGCQGSEPAPGDSQSALSAGHALKPLVQSSECLPDQQSPAPEELLRKREGEAGGNSPVPAVAHLLAGSSGQHRGEVVVAHAGPGSSVAVEHLQDGSVFGNTGWRHTQSQLWQGVAAAAQPPELWWVSCTHPRLVAPWGPTGDSWPRPRPADSPGSHHTPASAAPASGAACRTGSGSPGKSSLQGEGAQCTAPAPGRARGWHGDISKELGLCLLSRDHGKEGEKDQELYPGNRWPPGRRG